MPRYFIRAFLAGLIFFLFAAAPAHAQDFGQVEGYVYGPDGKGLANAAIRFERSDYPYHVDTKTDKKGYYSATVRSGDYAVSCTVDGNLIETRHKHIFPGQQRFQAGIQDNGFITFRLEAAGSPAVSSSGGSVAPASPGTAGEDKAATQGRTEQLAKQNNLNSVFAAGQAALAAKQYDQAIEALNKAVDLDTKQVATWQALAEAYMGASRSSKPPETDAYRKKAFDAYRKAIDLAPSNVGAYNNYALALAEDGKLDEARRNLTMAINLDPAGAAKIYFNLGTVLVEAGHSDDGAEQFKKATEADPKYAEAWYQYGVALASKATVSPSGKMVPAPGSLEALRKYLELSPRGPNAESAKQLIDALGGK